jgi:Tol biopolymer transport system component
MRKDYGLSGIAGRPHDIMLAVESIWRMAGAGGIDPSRSKGHMPVSGVRPLISSTRGDDNPQFSPDGKRIAFQSIRSGNEGLWISDGEGSNAMQLTSFRGPEVGDPRWSPDGERIVFDSDATGEEGVWVINASGGKPQRMTRHPNFEELPSWSHDGRWIYFDSSRKGEEYQVFKLPANEGEAIRITRDGGWEPVESLDGKFVYYINSHSLWRIPAEGGQAVRIFDGPLNGPPDLNIVGGWLYFLHGSSIQFLSFQTNKGCACGKR